MHPLSEVVLRWNNNKWTNGILLHIHPKRSLQQNEITALQTVNYWQLLMLLKNGDTYFLQVNRQSKYGLITMPLHSLDALKTSLIAMLNGL